MEPNHNQHKNYITVSFKMTLFPAPGFSSREKEKELSKAFHLALFHCADAISSNHLQESF